MSDAINKPIEDNKDATLYYKWYEIEARKVEDAEFTTSGLSIMLDALIHDTGLNAYYNSPSVDKKTVPEVWDKLVDVLGFISRDLHECAERLKNVDDST